jgi:transposase
MAEQPADQTLGENRSITLPLTRAAPQLSTVLAEAIDVVMIAGLNRLKGSGTNDASILVREAFWRDFRNRRELGGWSGLAPSPWASGNVLRSGDHEGGTADAAGAHDPDHLAQVVVATR